MDEEFFISMDWILNSISLRYCKIHHFASKCHWDYPYNTVAAAAPAAAKSLQSCPSLCDPIDSSSPVPEILQARTLEWVAISFSKAWKWKVAQLCPTLSDLMECSLPGSSIHGIFQARVLEWGATDFSGRLYVIFQNPISFRKSLSNSPQSSASFKWFLKLLLLVHCPQCVVIYLFPCIPH